MTSTQFYFALGMPFFTLLVMYVVTTVSNRATVNDLRSEMRAGFATVSDSINKRLDRIEAKQAALDTEIRQSHDHRLSVLEAHVLGKAS